MKNKQRSKNPLKHGIVLHVFVYYGDSALLRETFLCARMALPEARLVAVDDGACPCPDATRSELEKMGVEWRVSHWPRGGNLRGKSCILGILSEMEASIRHEDDVLIKMDADTCLLDGAVFRSFAGMKEKVLCGSGDPKERIYGCLYAIRAHALRRVRTYVEGLELDPVMPEDVTVGFSTMHLYPDPESRMVFPIGGKGDAWTAYRWGYYPDARPYRGCTMVTVGDPPPAPLTKEQRLPVMRNLRLVAQQRLMGNFGFPGSGQV